jgi:predicted CoA-binding protein
MWMTGWRDETTIRRLLADAQTWAVVGLSGNRSREAWSIAQWLQQQGKRVVPVHPSAEDVLGEKGYATLTEVPGPVDIVDVFVRSDLAGAVVDEAIAIGAPAVWLQLGVVDEAAAERAAAAGLAVVMDDCPHIEGPRLLGWPA